MQRISTWMAAVLFGCALLLPARAVSAQGFVVVTNAEGPSSMSRDDLARIFLKKSTRMLAVDQDKDAKVRASFSRTVLGRPLAAVLSYWQQQIFSGQESPPAEKGSDADVLAFVRSTPRGIGYVSPETTLGSGVQVLTVQ